MATKQERLEFATKAYDAGWPDDRVESWLYCTIMYETPLPHPSWSRDRIQATSNAALEAWSRDEPLRKPDHKKPSSIPTWLYSLLWAVGFTYGFLFGSTDANS